MILVAPFVLAIGLANADVYRWVDENGVVHFSDNARRLDAERVNVRSARTDPARVAAEREQAAERLSAEAEQREEREAAAQTSRQEMELRERNCAKARERLRVVSVNHRLVRTGEDGEVHYLSAEEIDTERAEARAAVAERCTG